MTSITEYEFSNPVVRRGLIAAALIAALSASAATAQSPFEDASAGNWIFATSCMSYTSVDDFLAALGGRPFGLEDYENLPFEMTIPDGTTVNGITYNYLGDFGIVDGLVGNQYANLGRQSLYYDKDSNGVQNPNDFFYANWGDKVVVTLPEPVLGAGMHFNVGGSPVLTDYVIMEAVGETAFSGGGEELRSPAGSAFFFVGLICDKPFTRATFYCRADAPTGFNLDNLYWVPVDAGDPCDCNCDGEINAFDIEPFLDLLFGGADPCLGKRGEPFSSGDINGDGVVDAFDIEPFLGCLFP